ncbi:LPS assembly lipoprotein LptE [Roseomonas sp. KE2513]|uniref:LPS assembly lipoprotein LptE n=1 Tax=Roseomonas sp. KE2513 TaxID=2479202 RepID=UPI0018DF759A|nr:LPS assembly lipoprotein LptE [Roseomonas sp. KE2513]
MSQAESSTSSSEARRGGIARRRLLAALGTSTLAGCGFHPLNAPPEPGEVATAVGPELAAIRIGPTYGRSGQLLHQGLERRLAARDRSAPAARYLLTTSVIPSYEAQGYRRDGSPSRFRITMSAPWTLSTLSVPPQQIATGTVRAMDSFNIVDLEFFSSTVSSEAAERRLVDRLAEDMTIRLALALRDRPAA